MLYQKQYVIVNNEIRSPDAAAIAFKKSPNANYRKRGNRYAEVSRNISLMDNPQYDILNRCFDNISGAAPLLRRRLTNADENL
jgi:hypothetical protein